jgi:hypothetical protein
MSMPKATDCINLVYSNMKAGYEESGNAEQFNRISQAISANDGKASQAIVELQRQGWKVVYFSPDAYNPNVRSDYFSNVRQHDPETYGYDYTASINKVMTTGKYGSLNIPVDAIVTNYKPVTEQKFDKITNKDTGQDDYKSEAVPADKLTTADTTNFEMLQSNPSVRGGIVSVKDGVHAAELIRSSDGSLQVYEAHYKNNPDHPAVISSTPLQNYDWGDFIVALPPGTDISSLKKPSFQKKV